MMKTRIASVVLLTLYSSIAWAHFPWLSADHEGNVCFCFGENPAETNYKLPGPIAKADVSSITADGKVAKVALKKIETDEFVGLKSEKPLKAEMLMTKVTYGLYAGSRLDYYAIHQAGPLPKDPKAYASKEKKSEKGHALDLRAELVDTDTGVDVYVMWKGKPLASADVTLFCEEGHEEGAATTDKEGKVSFSDKEVEDGLNGIMVGHKLAEDKGKFNGKEYSASSHYLTMTSRSSNTTRATTRPTRSPCRWRSSAISGRR